MPVDKKFLLFTDRKIDLMKEIKRKKFITRKQQSSYTSLLGFYLVIKFLERRGVVYCDGLEGREKRWNLTTAGEKILEHVIGIERLLIEKDVKND